jgi:hypothetical protein
MPLKVGMQGKKIALLQAKLIYGYGVKDLPIDGKFGAETRDALYVSLSWYERTPEVWKYDAAEVDESELKDINDTVSKKGGFNSWLKNNSQYQKTIRSYE